MAAIVGLVATVLGPTIELGKLIVKPIKRQFNYLCCFNSNIESLRDEVKKLDDARVGVQRRVDDAERNTRLIDPKVETWLDRVNAFQTDISAIESEIPNVKSGFLAIKSRFFLSRKAKKMVEAMKELQDNSKFDHVSQPALPAAMGSIPHGQAYYIESRKRIENKIMASLRENEVNIMGICGMGGVGKTTMAKKIMERVRDEHLFDEIVMAVVSRPVNMSQIQQEITESLGIRYEVESLSVRANQLRIRLGDVKKKLIVLDDLWERLNLEDLGIPHASDTKGCTILLTSRYRDVFMKMNVDEVFEVHTLSEEEALSLFKEKVGTCVNDEGLFSIAQEIAEECKGLPIALITVGAVLKNKRNQSLWNDTLKQLQSSNPTDMPDFLRDVYSPLKLSYDFLDSEKAKRIFLLCCLFPEDYNISINLLAIYCWGLGMFEGFRFSLTDAKSRVYTLVDLLKDRSLLLEGSDEYYVKMHNIVRDVAIFIASKQNEPNLIAWPHEQSYCNCSWISSYHMEERSTGLPTGWEFPNLRLLLIDNITKKGFHYDDNIFEGVRNLNVLFIKGYSSRSLPHTTQILRNLRTLWLDSCGNIKTISFVGELVNLEILICHQCRSVKELPVEMRRLNHLRSLEFRGWRLKTIAPGIISSLAGLENLDMIESFSDWEGEKMSKKIRNARVRELESLSKLTSLSINLKDPCLAAEQIILSPNVVEFNIRIGETKFDIVDILRSSKSSIHLVLEREMTLGDWVHKLLRRTYWLYLEGEGSRNLVPLLSEFHKLRSLQLVHFSLVNETSLFDGRSCGRTTSILPFLEFVLIDGVSNLEEIYNGPIPSIDSFKNFKELSLNAMPALKHLWKSQYVSLSCNLSSIEILKCDGLHNLFPLVKASDCPLQCEKLLISYCIMMEQVFLCSEDENDDDKDIGKSSLTFPKLEILYLSNLPRLTTFCQGIEGIEFPLLSEVSIENCPQLKTLASATTSSSVGGINHDDGEDNDADSLHLFCNPKAVFGMLNDLTISGYDEITSNTSLWCRLVPIDFFIRLEKLHISLFGNIRSLFSFSIAQNLANLKSLRIGFCGKMVKVVDDEEDCGSHESKRLSLFPKLEYLHLIGLSKLKSFCEWRSALELPSLEHVEIIKCSEMERFTLGSLATPSLETIYINYRFSTLKDLNDALKARI